VIRVVLGRMAVVVVVVGVVGGGGMDGNRTIR
jgi:hypothetical protein